MTSRSAILCVLIYAIAISLFVGCSSKQPEDIANVDLGLASATRRFADNPIVKEKSCVTCHTIGTEGGTVGPILNQIANRRDMDWMRKWLKDPNRVAPGTKMPNFQFTDEQIESLINDLQHMRREINPQEILSQGGQQKEVGERLFETYDCYACHRIGDKGRFIGPNLTWVGRRKSEAWEKVWLKDPPAYKPDTFMPNFHLSQPEIDALTAFVHSLQGQHNEAAKQYESLVMFILNSDTKEVGKFVFERFACWSCHGKKGFGGIKNPNAATEDEEYTGEVPPLEEVTDLLEGDEIKEIILHGSTPDKFNPDGPAPPYRCPSWEGAMTQDELEALLVYLESLAPPKPKFRLVE